MPVNNQPSSFRARTAADEFVSIEVRGTRIESITPIAADPSLPLALPVLVDLQQNGALGSYYNELPEHGMERLSLIADHLRRHGVGRCLLTLITGSEPQLLTAASELGRVLDNDAALASLFCGIFHEGVFISPQDGWRGAHCLDFVSPPSYERLAALDAALGGRICLVNVAPEVDGAMPFIEQVIGAGKQVAMGHCNPSPQIIDAAIQRGVRFVTHFGNGAPSQIHRFNNPYWAFLDRPELNLGLICDGFHLPGEMVRIALACKGKAACLPVSDASGYSGMPAGKYDTFNRHFTIEPSGKIHLTDSEILSGAWFQQDRSVEFLVRQAGMSFVEAWEQCSLVPARAMGLTLPRLAVGEEASFVLAHWQDAVVIQGSMHRGVWYAPEQASTATAPR